MRHASSYDEEYMNGDMHARHSMPSQFNGGSSFLQDIAYSAQQALDQTPENDELVPVDPALQAYTNGDYSNMNAVTSYHGNGDTVMSSVEYQPAESMPMNGVEFIQHSGEPHGPSVEALTPGPVPHNETTHTQTNGFTSKSAAEPHAVRHLSSPVSAASPTANGYNPYITSPATNNYNNFTTNSDFPPPPVTPTVNAYKAARAQQQSSARKSSHTPSRGGRNSKTPKSTPGSKKHENSGNGIKLENGMSMGTGMGMNMGMLNMIDPNLDQASFDLIKQLQQEDLGLRRRSR